jgi:hypothetical protein
LGALSVHGTFPLLLALGVRRLNILIVDSLQHPHLNPPPRAGEEALYVMAGLDPAITV